MRIRLAPVALALLSAIALQAGAAGPGVDAITEILTSAPGWTVYIETTPELTPGERATKAGYRFVRRGTEVVGMTTAMAPGFNCEFKVRVRDDGVDLHARSRACNDRYGDDTPYTMFEYTPADQTFPFKRLQYPQKWWLSPMR